MGQKDIQKLTFQLQRNLLSPLRETGPIFDHWLPKFLILVWNTGWTGQTKFFHRKTDLQKLLTHHGVQPKKDAQKWTPKLVETGDRSTGSQIKRHQLVAAAVNRTLYRFLHHHAGSGSGSAPTAPGVVSAAASSSESSESSLSAFPEHYFSAVVLLEGTHQKGRPFKLQNEHPMFLFSESVNRSVRLLTAAWTNDRIKIDRPWTFIWMADLILNAMNNLQRSSNSKPLAVIVFPIGWLTTIYNNDNGHVGLEGSCVSKSSVVPFVTVSHWEEES